MQTLPWLAMNISTLQLQSAVVLYFEILLHLEAQDLFTWAEVTICNNFHLVLHTVTTFSSREVGGCELMNAVAFIRLKAALNLAPDVLVWTECSVI